MAEGFRWTRRGYRARLEPAEARLLRGLFKDVATLLTGRRDDAAGDSAAPARDAASTAPVPGRPDEGTTTTADSASEDASSSEQAGDESTDGSGADGAFWSLVSGLSLGASTREAPACLLYTSDAADE